jgi:hypothetical protein
MCACVINGEHYITYQKTYVNMSDFEIDPFPEAPEKYEYSIGDEFVFNDDIKCKIRGFGDCNKHETLYECKFEILDTTKMMFETERNLRVLYKKLEN